jgi:hypothetical protein
MRAKAMPQSRGQVQEQGQFGTHDKAANQWLRGVHGQEMPCDDNVEDEDEGYDQNRARPYGHSQKQSQYFPSRQGNDDYRDQQSRINSDSVEDHDPTYAFGGSGARNTPLALSEGFEEFGIDDRIYTGKYQPTDTFALDSSEEMPDISQQTSNTIGPSSSISSLPSRNKDESIDSMPSPTRVGLQSRPKKADAFGKWREDRRVATMQNNAQRQNRLGGNESNSVASSRFSRSNKYRDVVLGAPYRMESTQTQKWSNRSTVRENRPPNMIPIHDEEEGSDSIYSESSRLARHSKLPTRRSPHSGAHNSGGE